MNLWWVLGNYRSEVGWYLVWKIMWKDASLVWKRCHFVLMLSCLGLGSSLWKFRFYCQLFLPHLIFWFHVKTFQIHLRLKMLSIQHPEFIMTTKKMDGFKSNCSDLQVSLILCMNNPLCKNAQTISWCQWVWDGGGENDCHLCCYVSCTFLHLTADCDGWEKTDPGDSLDAEEGEGWGTCDLCVTLRSWTNACLNIQNETVFTASVFTKPHHVVRLSILDK